MNNFFDFLDKEMKFLFEFEFISYLSLSACLIGLFLTYFTFKQHSYRQKYSHIPGPPSEGFKHS